MVGPLFFVATLCDVTVVADKGLRISRGMGAIVDIFLMASADDVSCLAVGDTRDDLQTSVDVMTEQFELYFSSAGLKMNLKKS